MGLQKYEWKETLSQSLDSRRVGGMGSFSSSTFSLGPSEEWAICRRAPRGLPAPLPGSEGPGEGAGQISGTPGFLGNSVPRAGSVCPGGWHLGGEEGGAAPGSRLIGLGIRGQRLREGERHREPGAQRCPPSSFPPGGLGWNGVPGPTRTSAGKSGCTFFREPSDI